MTASGQEPPPAPQATPAGVLVAPPHDAEPSTANGVATLDPPHDEPTADEPGYGHGV